MENTALMQIAIKHRYLLVLLQEKNIFIQNKKLIRTLLFEGALHGRRIATTLFDVSLIRKIAENCSLTTKFVTSKSYE